MTSSVSGGCEVCYYYSYYSIINFIIDFIIKNVNIKNYNRKKNGENKIK